MSLEDIAYGLIIEKIDNIEWLDISETADEEDVDAQELAALVYSAKVEITWDE